MKLFFLHIPKSGGSSINRYFRDYFNNGNYLDHCENYNKSEIENFLKNKNNLFSLEGENRVKTGYFGSTSKTLIPFLNFYDPEEMIKKNLHIEDLMYEYFKDKNTEFLQTNTTLWKNYLTGVYEKY